MSARWDRLESMVHSTGLTDGLAARVADPLWMLARQLQVGEFTGDDAAQPAAARVVTRTARIASYRPGAGPAEPYPTDRPLELVVEAAAEPDLGTAGRYAAARAARRLIRALRDARLATAVPLLRKAFPPPPAEPVTDVGAAGRAAAELLARWSLDVARLGVAPEADLRAALTGLGPDARDRAVGLVAAWQAATETRAGSPAWDEHRLEHSFSLAAATDTGEVVLDAPEHDGGHLDWYTVDVSRDEAARHALDPVDLPRRTTVAVPTPIRYPGMPASRWWEFEDGAVHFGDIEAGPADLARLLVAEFATVYADDHFVVPVPVPVGSLTEVESVEVVDTFGGRTRVPSAAKTDVDRAGAGRVWRMFELTGDEVSDSHPAPWLFVPPTGGALAGPVLERVTLTRDEAANLAWGIEQLIEGPLGRAVERTGPRPPAQRRGEVWRYRLAATAPPWWVPFVAERLADDTPQVRLRRARMRAWAGLDGQPVGPRSVLLDPRRPVWLYEEEVPAGGVRVERSWQLARWHDGSVHVWLQRRKRPGRGDPASGVRWDLLA
ncbi:hypothetical protein [Micromonospora sp. NPDC126480]|uniref:hypothetical protein n=1 Tax=Micromonospora sp. NPDC126480 TaxID=3155312 RepID=UPI00332961D6